jgi:hypothetical protein
MPGYKWIEATNNLKRQIRQESKAHSRARIPLAKEMCRRSIQPKSLQYPVKSQFAVISKIANKPNSVKIDQKTTRDFENPIRRIDVDSPDS